MTPQFLTWDAGSGPSRDYWSRHLFLKWKNPNKGDWLDATGAQQGGAPFATAAVSGAPRTFEVDITNLASRWVSTGENKGAMLRHLGGPGYVTWAGRLSATPPVLVVTTDQGEFSCPGLLASFSPTSSAGIDTRAGVRQLVSSPVIAQFDLSGVRGTVQRAVMKLTATIVRYNFTLGVFEVDAPRFQLGSDGADVQLGLAARVGEAGLRSHPSVIRAGDFAEPAKLFDRLNLADVGHEVLDDPDAPGTKMFRSRFVPAGRGSFGGFVNLAPADKTDPKRPAKVVNEELFCRLYVFLEDDWNSVRDANKMAIGWDLRMGWWNDAQGGYWQSTTGNGGAPGTGLKVPCRTKGRTHLWEYQGHSIRMEAGKAPGDGNPYSHLRPLQSYVYHLDQPTGFGQMVRLGSGVITKGRWHCLEQRIKMNSVEGPFDACGNGVAVADGELDTWLDGVPVSQVRGLRWRRHPEMGIVGPWINWFYGGKQPTEVEMHYRMNHFVLAREYIGPRVG